METKAKIRRYYETSSEENRRTVEVRIEITTRQVQNTKCKRSSLYRGLFLFSSVFVHVLHRIWTKWGLEGVLWKIFTKFRLSNYLHITRYLGFPANHTTKSPGATDSHWNDQNFITPLWQSKVHFRVHRSLILDTDSLTCISMLFPIQFFQLKFNAHFSLFRA